MRGKASAHDVSGGWRTLQLREVHNVRRAEAVQKGVNLDNLSARDRQHAARSSMIKCDVRRYALRLKARHGLKAERR